MPSYPTLLACFFGIRASPALPQPRGCHQPWLRDGKTLHLPCCVIHVQGIPSPLHSLCRFSTGNEIKRNPLYHGKVRGDREGEESITKNMMGGDGPGKSQESYREKVGLPWILMNKQQL